MSLCYTLVFILLIAFLTRIEGALVGGYGTFNPPNIDDVNSRYWAVKNFAIQHVLGQNVVSPNCESSLQPYNVESQVVAGVNYKFDFNVEPSCSQTNSAMRCVVVVFSPLPHTGAGPSLSRTSPDPVCKNN